MVKTSVLGIITFHFQKFIFIIFPQSLENVLLRFLSLKSQRDAPLDETPNCIPLGVQFPCVLFSEELGGS